MKDATWRHTGLSFGGSHAAKGRRKHASMATREALRALGPVVYAARLADGTIKIGWTANFEDRMRYLVSYVKQDVELLAFRPGTRDDEREIHDSLTPFRSAFTEQAREFYHPAPEVLAVVNEMRDGLNMPHVA